MAFKVRQLHVSGSLGKELHAMRRRLAISLDSVAEHTKIQKHYLRAIEEGDWTILPEPIYTRNFLRSYANFLGGDPQYFLSRFEKERASCDYLKGSQVPRQRVGRGRLFVFSHLWKFGVFAVVLLALFGYMGYQIHAIVKPPEIVLHTPHEGFTTETPTVRISGEILEESTVTVNGDLVPPTENGTFQTEVTLERGLNVVTIEGKKRYSRPSVIHRTIIFDSKGSGVSLGE